MGTLNPIGKRVSIRIEGKRHGVILVDGEEVRGVTGIRITASPNGFPVVSLEFETSDLEVVFTGATVEGAAAKLPPRFEGGTWGG
jgi:hypothetical protein